MICKTCHGTGKDFVGAPIVKKPLAEWLAGLNKPCPDCGGSGIVHCCEGDQAQPEPTNGDRP